MAKVLLIEDDPQLVKLYTKKFTFAGYEVLSAREGSVGLKMALEQAPDIIVLDVILPELDGEEVLKRLRKDEKGNQYR